MRIQHNIAAMNTQNAMQTNQANVSNSLAKLSSGYRINKAGDDAAGLAISEKMRAQIRGLDMASKNAQDGISMVQTAEGALSTTHDILQRMRELADQSSNGTNTDDDRKAIQNEVSQLKSELDRIGDTTEFNTTKLLNGSLAGASAGSVGQSKTTGAVISKLTSASLSAERTISGVNFVSSGNMSKVDTLLVDGHQIDVDWNSLLSADEKATINVDYSGTSPTTITKQKVNDILEGAINKAIDAYNATNTAGASVQHVDLYLSGGTGAIVMTSASKGTDSQIGIYSKTGDNTSVGGLYLSASSGMNISSGIGSNTSGGPNVAYGTTTYNGENAIAATDQMKMNINGITIQFSGVVADTGSGMATVAALLQSGMNASISGYNLQAGKVDGDAGFIRKVAVTVSKDGRLEVNSESGPISFEAAPGTTALKALGLTQTQTDSAGSGGMTFQIGANRNQTITFGISDMRSAALGVANVDVSSKSGAAAAITNLDAAIQKVSSERAKLGAVQNRLDYTIRNLSTASENMTAAESRIRDVDMAKEMMNFSKNNILMQAAQSMLSQANQQPQAILQLLK